MSIYDFLTFLPFIGFLAGIVAWAFAGRFYPSGKRALALCLVPLVAIVLMKMFC
jgi:hypothetical protein